MLVKLLLVTFVVILQQNAISGQRQWVLPTTTAAEMRNPYTWYWPYAIAAAEGWRDYYTNAQEITNQLYFQAQITQAFPWSTNPQQQRNRWPYYYYYNNKRPYYYNNKRKPYNINNNNNKNNSKNNKNNNNNKGGNGYKN